MTDKISFLRFFFDSGKYTEPAYAESVMDFYPDVTFIFHVESSTIHYVNKSFTSFFGLTSKDIREDENVLATFIFKDDVPRFKNALEQGCMPGGKDVFSFTSRLNHKEGECFPFRIQGTVLKRNTEGKAYLILFVATDGTEEEKNKKEINSLKNLFLETEEMFHFGTWTLSVKDHTMTWTQGLLNLFGYAPEELPVPLPMSFYFDHLVNGYKDALAEIIDQAIYTQTDFEYEYVIQTRNATQKTVFTKGKLVRDAAGNVEKIMGITRDITTLRNFERDQERHIRQLNKSNKELEEFAYIASHDLQEPLRKITMFGERLRLKFGNSLDQEGELFLSRILSSSASMKTLIDNLLEFSRANRSSNNFSTVDLRTLFGQAISDLELKIEETQTKIEVKGVLPRIEAVSSEMKQLFTNLLSNSIKFRKETSPSSVEVSVRKLTKDEKRAYHLQTVRTFYKIDFRDNGIGFDEEYSDKIFEIFQRLHGKTEYPGCGIGLAICKKIIENHSGIISAHSMPDEGAIFTVILPEKQF
jgi:PAS domain S-box-containing protein